MKVITNDAIYIQRSDFANIIKIDLNVPTTLRLQAFNESWFMLDDDNRFDFMRFDKPEEVAYLKSLDWIIDYSSVKDLSEEEIIKMSNKLIEQRNSIIEEYERSSYLEKTNNIDMINRYRCLSFEINSLRDILNFKRNNLIIELPKGVEYPTGVKHENGIRRILKRIMKKLV